MDKQEVNNLEFFHTSPNPNLTIGTKAEPWAATPHFSKGLYIARTALQDIGRLAAIAEFIYWQADKNLLDNFSTMLIEQALENIRLAHFPYLPTRIGSTFLFDNIEQARTFNAVYHGGNRTIYKCKFQGIYIIKDMNLINKYHVNLHTNLSSEVERLHQMAYQYWLGEDPPLFPEIITPGDVEILEKVEVLHP